MKACARINTTFVKTAKITTLKRYQFVIADVKALFLLVLIIGSTLQHCKEEDGVLCEMLKQCQQFAALLFKFLWQKMFARLLPHLARRPSPSLTFVRGELAAPPQASHSYCILFSLFPLFFRRYRMSVWKHVNPLEEQSCNGGTHAEISSDVKPFKISLLF